MRNHILKTGAALLAAGIFLFVSNGNFSAFEFFSCFGFNGTAVCLKEEPRT